MLKSYREVADQEFEAAKANFPSEEVSGAEEKLGMGTADKEFDTIKSFTWTFGGTGSVKINKVQDVSLNKTPKINLDIEEVTKYPGQGCCRELHVGGDTRLRYGGRIKKWAAIKGWTVPVTRDSAFVLVTKR